MNATNLLAKNDARQTASRPVPQMLLELAYHLHATKVVKVLPAQADRLPLRRRSAMARLSAERSV